jgi:hypothetical protein
MNNLTATITIAMAGDDPEEIVTRVEFSQRITLEELKKHPVGRAAATMMGAVLEYSDSIKVNDREVKVPDARSSSPA